MIYTPYRPLTEAEYAPVVIILRSTVFFQMYSIQEARYHSKLRRIHTQQSTLQLQILSPHPPSVALYL